MVNKRWKKILLLGVLPVALIGLAIYWFTWAGTTKPIESVADQFKVPSSWNLERNDARAPGLCIATTCPNLIRTWAMNKPVTQNELTKVVKDSGWLDVKIQSGCKAKPGATGTYICDMYGKVKGYRIMILPSSDPKPEVSLLIK